MTIHTHSVYSVVGAQLERLFNTEDWDELRIYLGRLSHKDFQTAGKIIGETLLPSVDENKFWAAFYCLIDFHPKAFLMTMLKAIPKRYNNKTFNLRHNGFIVVSNYLNTKNATIDKEKIIRFMLNVLDNPDDIDYLFTRFKIDTPKDKLEYLLRGRTMAAYFVMFKTLREVEHDRSLLNRCAVFLRSIPASPPATSFRTCGSWWPPAAFWSLTSVSPSSLMRPVSRTQTIFLASFA